jgi:hypothetical protein
VISAALHFSALCGVGALLVMPDSGAAIAVWGVLITSVAGLIAQALRASEDRKRAAQAHKFAMEERNEANASRAQLQGALAENTAITLQVGAKADQAYDTANHVNEKIATLAAAAVSAAQADTALIRGDIAAATGHNRRAGDKK